MSADISVAIFTIHPIYIYIYMDPHDNTVDDGAISRGVFASAIRLVLVAMNVSTTSIHGILGIYGPYTVEFMQQDIARVNDAIGAYITHMADTHVPDTMDATRICAYIMDHVDPRVVSRCIPMYDARTCCGGKPDNTNTTALNGVVNGLGNGGIADCIRYMVNNPYMRDTRPDTRKRLLYDKSYPDAKRAPSTMPGTDTDMYMQN